jgi:hypothetical protein
MKLRFIFCISLVLVLSGCGSSQKSELKENTPLYGEVEKTTTTYGQPSANTESPESLGLVGHWKAVTGSLSSQNFHEVTLNADMSYEKTDAYQNDGFIKKSSGSYSIQESQIVFNSKEDKKLMPHSWRFEQYNDGLHLELLDRSSTQDWAYATSYKRD